MNGFLVSLFDETLTTNCSSSMVGLMVFLAFVFAGCLLGLLVVEQVQQNRMDIEREIIIDN